LGAAADAAKSILTTGLYPNEFIEGACDPLGAFDPSHIPQFNCTGGSGGMDLKKSKIPYAEQASLEIDRTLGKGLTINLGYLMVEAHRLVLGNGLNVSCPVGTSKPGNPAGPGIPAPFPTTSLSGPPGTAQGWLNPDGTTSACDGTPILLAGKPYFTGNTATQGYGGLEFSNGGFLDYNTSVVNAIYHGMTLQAIERMGKYLNLNANYTYSHIIDNGNFTTFINLPQNQFDNRSERGSSNQDARHRFVANFTATTPNHGAAKNFTLSSIVTIQSGRPFTMFTGGDSNGDTNPVTDRVGLSARNAYVGQPLRAWDFRVSRFFQINERIKADFVFDAFNLLNRQNVDEVATVYGSPVFCGAVPRHYGDAASLSVQQGSAVCPTMAQLAAQGQIPSGSLPPQFGIPPVANQTFGTPRAVLNPRQLQFAVKFSF